MLKVATGFEFLVQVDDHVEGLGAERATPVAAPRIASVWDFAKAVDADKRVTLEVFDEQPVVFDGTNLAKAMGLPTSPSTDTLAKRASSTAERRSILTSAVRKFCAGADADLVDEVVARFRRAFDNERVEMLCDFLAGK